MSDLNYVLRRIESGAKIRMHQDQYGKEKIEVRRAYLPVMRRVDLSRDEISQVKAALGSRSRPSKAGNPVKI